MSKEMQYRNDGMAFAYKIAKEQGIEALEKEIAYRNAKMMPSAVQRKDIEKFENEVKQNCLDTVLIMALINLRDEFEFGKVRLKRFKERFSLKTECLQDGDINWEDLRGALLEETGIETELRDDFLARRK